MLATTQRVAFIAAAGLCLVSMGCYGARRPESGATLEGTVTYGDQKIMVGLVIAQGEWGSTAFIDDDGRYKLENVPLGEVTLAVNTDAGKGQLISKAMAQSRGKPKALPRVVELPAKYQDPSKSGVKTTINKGTNTFDIVLPK
jgi:hypothetical protein